MDWFSISQGDPEQKLLGIKSLIKYATLCAFMLIPCELPLGLRWEAVGSEKPTSGTEIVNEGLAATLKPRTSHSRNPELTPSEWDRFVGTGLCSDCYIRVGGKYFKPAETKDVGDVSTATISPSVLPDYGARAWCRVEWFIFMLWAEMNGARPRQKGGALSSAAPVQLYAVTATGKLFQYDEVCMGEEKTLPSHAALSDETDRVHIRLLEEQMIDAHIPTFIHNLCGVVAELNVADRMLSDKHMPQLLDALRRLGPNTPGLKWKEIDEQDVDDDHLKEVLSEDLASALQEKQRFARVELESFKVSGLSYNSFIRAGGKCFRPQINKLILASKRLTAAGWKELGCFLATDSTLEDLDVQCGDFDAAGAAALVSGLKSNRGLKVLDCGFNEDAGSDWTVELAHALADNQQIEVLRACCTGLDDEGASALACMLESNTALEELWIPHNKITSKGATALARALKTNTSLLILILDGNPIGDEGALAIARALGEDNSALQTLHMLNNEMTVVGRTILRAAADEADVDLDSDFDNEDEADVDLFPDFDDEDDATDTVGEESEESLEEEEDEMSAFRELEIC
jgi:hypothetical protein